MLAKPAVGVRAAAFGDDRCKAKSFQVRLKLEDREELAPACGIRCASLRMIDLLTMSTPGVGGRCRNGPVVERPRLALGSKATSEADGTGG